MAERTKDEHDKINAAIMASLKEMLAPLYDESRSVPLYDSDRFAAWAAANRCVCRRKNDVVTFLFYDGGFVYRSVVIVRLPTGMK